MSRRGIVVVAVVAIVVTALATAVYASIPGPGGIINGCRKNSDGSLKVIDSAATCGNGYTALDWNQTGPQGPAGANGVSGYELATRNVALSPDTNGVFTVSCPTGKQALGGSATWQTNNTQTFSWPNGSFTATSAELLTTTTYEALIGGVTVNSVLHLTVTCATV